MRYVLFVCTHNAGRTQMAQPCSSAPVRGDCRGESAGSAPAKKLWPEVRSHILTPAHKRTRECLRNETCDVL